MNIEAMPLSELALVFTKNQRLYTIPLFEIRKVTFDIVKFDGSLFDFYIGSSLQ